MQACQIMIAALSEFRAEHTRRQICSARIFHGPCSNAKELVTYVAMLKTGNAIFENLAVRSSRFEKPTEHRSFREASIHIVLATITS
jgi:hypothetical protein